jgi:hypothetical protein
MRHTNDPTSETNPRALWEEFAEILEFAQTAFQQARTAHEVETGPSRTWGPTCQFDPA